MDSVLKATISQVQDKIIKPKINQLSRMMTKNIMTRSVNIAVNKSKAETDYVRQNKIDHVEPTVSEIPFEMNVRPQMKARSNSPYGTNH